MVLPRFDRLKLLSIAIKNRLGTNNYDCHTQGHYVPPEVISKKIEGRHFRFITDCWQCKKQLFFDCAYNDQGELMVVKREYNGFKDLAESFSKINENEYYQVHEPPHINDHRLQQKSCRICDQEVFVSPLCQEHTMQGLFEQVKMNMQR